MLSSNMQRVGRFVTVLDKMAVINGGSNMTQTGDVMDIRHVRGDVSYSNYFRL